MASSERVHLRVVRDLNENGEVTNCPHCAAAYAEAEVWREDVVKLKRQVKALQEDRDEKMRQDASFPAALDLWDLWKSACKHPRAKLDSNRTRLLLTAAKLYKDERDKLRWVVFYGRDLAFVDDRGHKHDSIGLLFRDAEHIERYAVSWWRHARQHGLDLETGEKA